jgi:hypothetical protein
MVSLYWATSPKWKILKVVRNARISKKKKWFHCNGQLAQTEDEKSF